MNTYSTNTEIEKSSENIWLLTEEGAKYLQVIQQFHH